ncbi:Uncharacterised protein [uncultured archaeon]|nr:Uncharacterised protein [uncultured archaeon]
MSFLRTVFALALLLLFFGYASAAYVKVSAIGGPFVTDSNILVAVNVYDNNGAAKNNVDLNTYVISSAGTESNLEYSGSVQGLIFRNDINFSSAGDYNIVAVDLNDNVSANVRIKVSTVKSVTVTFNNHNPPFDKTKSEDINFTLRSRNAAGSDLNLMLTARLVSDSNGGVASHSLDVNANDVNQNRFNTAGLSQGLFYLDINNGLASFPVPVFTYKGFQDLQDDSNNSGTVYGPSGIINIVGKVSNFDQNVNQGISSVTVTVRDPEGDTTTLSSSACDVNSRARCRYTLPSDANSGDYVVTTSMVVGGDTVTVKRTFSVKTYELKFYAMSFSGGNSGKEKMPSVYPMNTDVNFEAHFVKTVDDNELSGDADLNKTFCQDSNIAVTIQKMGSTDVNEASSKAVRYDVNSSNFCNVKIRSPNEQGTFIVTAIARYGNETLRRSTILTVQNYLIFLQPVSPSTYDPTTPTGKFGFYKGESIGFKPNYVDLNGSMNPRIVRVSAFRALQGSTPITIYNLNTADNNVTWDSDKNIIVLSAASANRLAGGFVPISVTVDVNNAAGADNNGMTAFGMFKFNVLNLTAVLASGAAGTTKSNEFGPPSVSPDENIFIKILAVTGNNSGVSGATVSLLSMRNVDTWTEIDVSSVPSKLTDENGLAVMNIGTLQQHGLGSGGYFTEFQVATTDGNTDTVETFFESRRFVVFLQPLDRESGTQCSFLQGFRKDQNASFLVRAFNPAQGFGAGDINVAVASISNPVNLMFFGSMSKPQFPPSKVLNVNYDVNSHYLCSVRMGQGDPSDKNYTMITLRKGLDSNWATGMYSPMVSIVGTDAGYSGYIEAGRGFMQVQPFTFGANPTSISSNGPPSAKPGTAFGITVSVKGTSSDSNVTITAKLVDMQSGGNFEFSESGNAKTTDLNIGLVRPGAGSDCNSASCPNKSVSVRSSSSGTEKIAVLVPSTATSGGEYNIQFTATDTQNNAATAEVYFKSQLYKLVNFGWYNNLYGVYPDLLSSTASGDWNASTAYNKAYTKPSWVGGSGEAPMLDYNFLADYTNRRLVVDLNSDRNFLSRGDLNVNIDSNSLSWDINNMYRITDISSVGPSEPGIKFIRKTALDTNSSTYQYLGAYPADTNFTIPIMVKNPDGTSVTDVNVVVTNIGMFSAGSFFPENLSTRSCGSANALSELLVCNIDNDFNAFAGKTDANGFALIKMRVAKPSTRLMLEITVFKYTDPNVTQTQRFQQFEGPVIDVKKYAVTSKVAGPTFRVDTNADRTALGVTFDVNAGATGMPITSPLALLAPGKVLDSNIGVFTGTFGDGNGLLGDVNADRNWYFVVVDGNTLVIDDDLNMTLFKNGNPNANPDENGAAGDGNTGTYRAIIVRGPDINSASYVQPGNPSIMPMAQGADTPRIYLASTGVDSNVLDGNILFYPVYMENFGSNSPNKDTSLRLALSLSTLAGVASGDTYSISNVRLENRVSWTSTSICSTCSSYANKTGTTLIDLGNFTGRQPGQYEVVFTLTAGGVSTEERTGFQVRN